MQLNQKVLAILSLKQDKKNFRANWLSQCNGWAKSMSANKQILSVYKFKVFFNIQLYTIKQWFVQPQRTRKNGKHLIDW